MMSNQVENAYKWLNSQIKADKIRRKKFKAEDTEVFASGVATEKEIMVYNILAIADIVGLTTYRADWSGNKHCNTHHDIIWFTYNNYKFFELVDKGV